MMQGPRDIKLVC